MIVDDDKLKRNSANFSNYLSINGIVYPALRRNAEIFFIGVMNGSVNKAARNDAKIDVPRKALSKWFTEQGTLIDQKKYSVAGTLEAAHRILLYDGDPRKLVFCFAGGRFVTIHAAEEIINRESAIYILLEESGYADTIESIGLRQLDYRYFTDFIKKNVFCAETVIRKASLSTTV